MPEITHAGVTFIYSERSTGNPSPVESYATDSMRMVRELFIQPGTQEARYAASKYFLGSPVVKEIRSVTTGALIGRWVSRDLPDFFEFTDTSPALIATSVNTMQGVPPGVRVDGVPAWDEDFLVNQYGAVQMNLEYRSTNYEIAADENCLAVPSLPPVFGYFVRNSIGPYPDEGLMQRFIERTWRYAGAVFSIRSGFTCFTPDAGETFPGAANALPNESGYPIWEPKIEYTYVHRELPLTAVPLNAIANCLQTMNAPVFGLNPGNFDPTFWNRTPYTLLFTGCTPHICKLITGEVGVNMEYKFLYAPNVVRYGTAAGTFGGWRRALTQLPPGTPNAGQFDYREIHGYRGAGIAPTTDFPIRATDFSTLFRPDQT